MAGDRGPCVHDDRELSSLFPPQTFRSKEISKSNVVDDIVSSNELLYSPGEHPDHCIVIKYIPYVGDSKVRSRVLRAVPPRPARLAGPCRLDVLLP